jgi:hypothetical protein
MKYIKYFEKKEKVTLDCQEGDYVILLTYDKYHEDFGFFQNNIYKTTRAYIQKIKINHHFIETPIYKIEPIIQDELNFYWWNYDFTNNIEEYKIRKATPEEIEDYNLLMTANKYNF